MSPVKLCLVYAHRARQLGLRLLNSVTDEMYDDALDTATSIEVRPRDIEKISRDWNEDWIGAEVDVICLALG